MLSKEGNVAIKISGLGMVDNHWTLESITPYVNYCIDTFGVDRCMFASNFPVEKVIIRLAMLQPRIQKLACCLLIPIVIVLIFASFSIVFLHLSLFVCS